MGAFRNWRYKHFRKQEPLDSIDLINLTQDVVEDYGYNYQYPFVYGNSCYIKNGKPSNLIGHVLFKWGVPTEVLSGGAEDDRLGPNYRPIQQRLMPTLLFLPADKGRDMVTITPEAFETLTLMESYEEHGYTWGEILNIVRGDGGSWLDPIPAPKMG